MKLAIDIGHGIDTYPPSKGIGDFAEFTFNNAVGKVAKDLGELNNFTIFLPQPFDSNAVGLNERARVIKEAKCDLVISIHANAAVPAAHGREVWYWNKDIQAERLAKLWSANAVSLGNKDRGIKVSSTKPNENFGILRMNSYNGIPAILIEAGFFTNDFERETLLKNSNFINKVAETIVKTACDYYNMPFIKEVPKPTIHIGHEWSEDAREWALLNRISDCSRLDQPATREEVITMLYNTMRWNDGKQEGKL